MWRGCALRANAEFPGAAIDIVQRMREPMQSLAQCEAVARLRQAPAQPLVFLDPPGLTGSPGPLRDRAGGRSPGGAYRRPVGFRIQRTGPRGWPSQRLAKALDGVGASYSRAAVAEVYPLSRSIAELVRKVEPEFFDRTRPPAGVMPPFEGLPSLRCLVRPGCHRGVAGFPIGD